jgi:sugar phosphate isomerase/epimerase
MVTYCINTCSLGATPRGRLDLPGQLRAASEAGYPLVGLDIKTIEAHLEHDGTLSGIRQDLSGLGLECYEVHVLRCLDPGESEAEHLSKSRWIAQVAGELGASWVNNTVNAALSQGTVDHLHACADIMASESVKLSIEFQPESACATAEDAHRLIRALNRPDVGLQPDTWHLFRGSGAVGYLSQVSPQELSFVQFGDGAPDRRATDDRALPGDGVFDLEGYVRNILGTGFDGVVEIETFVSELMSGDPAASGKKQLEATKRYWSPDGARRGRSEVLT